MGKCEGNLMCEKPMSKEERASLYKSWKPESWKILVERNILLAIGITKHYPNAKIEREELNAIAFLRLVKAAKKFNPDLGNEFATFAAPVIKNEILQEIHKRKIHPYPDMSINEPVYVSENGMIYEYADLIPGTFDIDDHISCVLLKDAIKHEFYKCCDLDKQIILLFLSGKTQEEIAQIVGTTQASICRKIKKFKKKVKEHV